MCTIGNVFPAHSNASFSFKQCDLIKKTDFIPPKITAGKDEIRYLPFLRDGSKGPWAGINNYGVSFVAADSYLAADSMLLDVNQDIFEAYTSIISDFKTAEQAAKHMVAFYKTFNSPDILLINDPNSAYFIEANDGAVEYIERTDHFFASTNHFRILYGGVPYINNHSTYLRLQRAEAILQNNPGVAGILDVVSDQYFGETVMSICRVNKQTPPQAEPYYTQATAIFYANGQIERCAYQLNGNPRTNKFVFINDIFGDRSQRQGLSCAEVHKFFNKS